MPDNKTEAGKELDAIEENLRGAGVPEEAPVAPQGPNAPIKMIGKMTRQEQGELNLIFAQGQQHANELLQLTRQIHDLQEQQTNLISSMKNNELAKQRWDKKIQQRLGLPENARYNVDPQSGVISQPGPEQQ